MFSLMFRGRYRCYVIGPVLKCGFANRSGTGLGPRIRKNWIRITYKRVKIVIEKAKMHRIYNLRTVWAQATQLHFVFKVVVLKLLNVSNNCCQNGFNMQFTFRQIKYILTKNKLLHKSKALERLLGWI